MKYKKTVLLDFDGVLHSYKSGWKGARNIPDPPVPGMLEWLMEFLWDHCDPPDCICSMAPAQDWEVCIYSSRSRKFGGKIAMRRWMIKHGFDYRLLQTIKFPVKKPAAFITIDDRAICFNGNSGMVKNLTRLIMDFKPWHKEDQGWARPLELRILKEGKTWCATWSDFVDLPTSEAGFGETPELALADLRDPATGNKK